MSWLPAWSSCRWCDIHCVSIRLGAVLDLEHCYHPKRKSIASAPFELVKTD